MKRSLPKRFHEDPEQGAMLFKNVLRWRNLDHRDLYYKSRLCGAIKARARVVKPQTGGAPNRWRVSPTLERFQRWPGPRRRRQSLGSALPAEPDADRAFLALRDSASAVRS